MAPLKILIADDEPTIQDTLGRLLRSKGFTVHAAVDGIAACDVAEAVAPDLVILDLMLPRRDGYAVLLHLRSRPVTRETPVIFVSGEPQETHDPIARSLGAQAYLPKPFDFERVMQAIETLLPSRVGEKP